MDNIYEFKGTTRNVCITSFIKYYKKEDIEVLVDEGRLRYAIVGRETCPTTGRSH